ncbi:MAG: GNAT family N-acetyltransferase [Treponema sp.]|nr:GNAT family N-acetyltransferase [Treponema sp.]
MNSEISKSANNEDPRAVLKKKPVYCWQKMKTADIPAVRDLLRDNENFYVNACARFIERQSAKEPVWLLRKKDGASIDIYNNIRALLISSKSTVIPVLRGIDDFPPMDFLKGFLRKKMIHSVQGLKNEVFFLENEILKAGGKSADIIDYDLMSLDKPPNEIKKYPLDLVLCQPKMSDIDAVAPLQAAYEREEVIPKGSVFNPAASRINISNIIAGWPVLAARLNDRFVGKINVSAVSFTRFQVGGVYVHPAFRGLGIAGKMTYEFISSLIEKGKGVTLFVKKNNIAARKLYIRLGFSFIGDYRITYY